MQVNVNSYLYRLVLIFFIALHIISTPRATKLIIKVSVNAKKNENSPWGVVFDPRASLLG